MAPLASSRLGFDLRYFSPVKGETELSDDAMSPCALPASQLRGLCATTWTACVGVFLARAVCLVCLCLHGLLVLPGLLLRRQPCVGGHALGQLPQRSQEVLHSCRPTVFEEALQRLPLFPLASFSVLILCFCHGAASPTSGRDLHIWLHVIV